MERTMNMLKPEHDEILGLLEEECAEVIQAVSKARRFGLDTEYQGTTKKAALQQEIGDVVALVYVIAKRFPELCADADLERTMAAKVKKLRRYVKSLADFEVSETEGKD